jgi:hypothetical protein
MYNKKLITLMSSVALLFVTHFSYGQCNARLNKVEHIFDNFDQYHALQKVDAKKQLRFHVINDEQCQLHIILSSENQTQLRGAFQTIAYQFRSNAQQLLSSSTSRLPLIDSKAEVELFIRAGVPVKSGVYSDRLQIKLYDKNKQLLDERQLDIETQIAPRTSLSVLGYNTFAHTINLGELTPRQTYTMLPSLQVVTNSDIKLRVSSDNKGKLIHSLYQQQYAIDYSLDMAGNWLTLSQDTQHTFSYEGQTVFLLPLKIQLADFKEQAAGKYSDTIRFQISPLHY